MLASTSPQHDPYFQDTAKLKHKHGIAIGHRQRGATLSTNEHFNLHIHNLFYKKEHYWYVRKHDAGTKSKKLKTYSDSLHTVLHEFALKLNLFIKEVTPLIFFVVRYDSVAVGNTVIDDILKNHFFYHLALPNTQKGFRCPPLPPIYIYFYFSSHT